MTVRSGINDADAVFALVALRALRRARWHGRLDVNLQGNIRIQYDDPWHFVVYVSPYEFDFRLGVWVVLVKT